MFIGYVLFLWVGTLCVTTGAHEHLSGNAEHPTVSKEVHADLRQSTRLASEPTKDTSDYIWTDLKALFKIFGEIMNSTSTENPDYATYSGERKTSTAPPKRSHGITSTKPTPTTPKAARSTQSYTKVSTSTEDVANAGKNAYSTTAKPPVESDSIRVGSIKGIPGVNFPNYTDIPMTSFSCFDKDYHPGFYADLESACQVFHVCWPNRRESFLCPMGTIFNQALLACDYWYSTNCSLAPHYYHVNAENKQPDALDHKKALSSMINVLLQKSSLDSQITQMKGAPATPETVLSFISQFLPIKTKVIVYPETKEKRSRIVASTSVGRDGMQVVHKDKNQKTPKVATEQHPSSSGLEKMALRSNIKVPKGPKNLKSNEGIGAIDVIFNRLSKAKKEYLQYIDDLIDGVDNHSSTTKTPAPTEEPDFDVPAEFQELDAALKKIVDKIIKKLKRRGVQKTTKPPPFRRNHSVTQPNPRFTKPTEIPNNVECRKDVPSTECSNDAAQVTSPTIVERKPTLTPLNPRFIIKPVKIPKRKVVKIGKVPTLTQLNQRFIIKPVEIPIRKVVKVGKVPPSTSKILNTRKRIIIHPSKTQKQVTGSNISPLTKKTLLENLIRLVKIKSA